MSRLHTPVLLASDNFAGTQADYKDGKAGFAVNAFSKYKTAILTIIGVIAVLALAGAFHITCPIKLLTGVSCPGCGMTRAWLSAIRLDFKKALYYHPAFFLGPVLLICIYKATEKEKGKKYRIALTAVSCILLICYFVRMAQGSDIVSFAPKEGLIYKLFVFMFYE